MPRPFRNRKICQPPQMAGFKPFGMPRCKSESIDLQFDEFESLKLVMYEKLSQDEAAEKMNVSRPTLTRVYNRGLEKIAKAFVEGLSIEFAGGNVEFEQEWFRCKKCFKLIAGLENHERCGNCQSFGKNELMNINEKK
ncbi:MAG: DUF134 domain-containing protein [Bacteroidota bacterium]